MAGSDETASIALLLATICPFRCSVTPAGPQVIAHDLKIGRLGSGRRHDVAAGTVAAHDRVQRSVGISHQPQSVLADRGILPADESLAGAPLWVGPEHDEQPPHGRDGRRASSNSFPGNEPRCATVRLRPSVVATIGPGLLGHDVASSAMPGMIGPDTIPGRRRWSPDSRIIGPKLTTARLRQEPARSDRSRAARGAARQPAGDRGQ